MTDIDKREFAAKMAILSEVFDDAREISKLKMEVYFRALEKYEIDQISKAISAMITERIYPSFPKPAEIVREIEGKKEDKGALAWIQVLGALRHCGVWDSAKFSDPVIHSVIQAMGGWIELGETLTVDQEKWKGKEFERLYAIMSARGGKHPGYLVGIHERDNAARGYHPGPVINMIGFDEAIRMIA